MPHFLGWMARVNFHLGAASAFTSCGCSAWSRCPCSMSLSCGCTACGTCIKVEEEGGDYVRLGLVDMSLTWGV